MDGRGLMMLCRQEQHGNSTTQLQRDPRRSALRVDGRLFVMQKVSPQRRYRQQGRMPCALCRSVHDGDLHHRLLAE